MRTAILAVAGALVAAIIAMVILVSPIGGWLGLHRGPELSPGMMNVEGADIGGPFELTTTTGERITSKELIDGPTLIYFGYTWCPDVCPLDTQKMADAVDLLAERGVEVTPVFITIDPERDTPEALGEWVGAVHPALVGLTGSAEDIAKVADTFKVYYQKVETPESAGGYSMNHTSFYYLMTPGNGLTAMFRDSVTAEEMADDIDRVLGSV